MKIQDYNFELRHVPEKTNTKADILSWLPWYPELLEKQKDEILLKDNLFVKRLAIGIPIYMFWEHCLEGDDLHIKNIEISTTITQKIQNATKKKWKQQ